MAAAAGWGGLPEVQVMGWAAPGPGGDSFRPDTSVRAPNLKDGEVPLRLVACGQIDDGRLYTGPGLDIPRVESVYALV